MVVLTKTIRKNARFRPAELSSCLASNHLSAPLLGPEGAVDAMGVIQWPRQGRVRTVQRPLKTLTVQMDRASQLSASSPAKKRERFLIKE